VLGDAGRRLLREGDPAALREARDRFAAAHAVKHAILRPAPDRAELVVGEDDWPLPIPLRLRGGAWRFDAAAAAQAITDRRIGRNELDTIESLRAIAAAQAEFAATEGHQGGFRAYARRFFASPGARDGLYWPAAEGAPESPLGPLLAAASAGAYAPRGDAPAPFRGYLYRILERQGPAAPGGAAEFVVDGRMIGGFAVLAWPARHGVTGLQSFLVSHHGAVWQRDLGPDTPARAAAITAFDPGPGWTRVAE